MPIPRRELIDPTHPGLYHCVSRCVRRAFLCGGAYEHRRGWIRDRLEHLAALFAIDVVGYAVMSNHLHTFLWTDPDRAANWTADEVARRWLTICKGSVPDDQPLEEVIRQRAANTEWIEQKRARLSSVSWFNRLLKQPISRRANAEDQCKGTFWEGRFRSHRVVDEAGALTVCIYIDLNEIRAGLAATPESSTFTSVRERIAYRQLFAAIEQRGERAIRRRKRQCSRRKPTHAEDGLWLCPFGRKAAADGRRTLFGCGVDAYLKMVDAVGRIVRGMKGAIPSTLAPIIQRLEFDLKAWAGRLLRHLDELRGTTIGGVAARVEEALRRGRRWVVDPLMG